MEKEIMVYVGPSLKNIEQTGAAFQGGYPPKLEQEMRKRPYLSELMIPAENLAAARKELRRAGSSLNQLYQKAKGGNEHV